MPSRLRLFSFAVCLGFFFITIYAFGQECKKCGLNSCECRQLPGVINIPEITDSINSADDSADIPFVLEDAAVSSAFAHPRNEAQSNTSMNLIPDTLTNEAGGVVGGAWSHGNIESKYDLVAGWYPQEQQSSIFTPWSPECASGWENSTEEALAQQTDQVSTENTVPGVDGSRFIPWIPFVNEAQPPIPIQPASRTLTNEPEGAVGGVGDSRNARPEHEFIIFLKKLEKQAKPHPPSSQQWREIWNTARSAATSALNCGFLRFQLHIGIASSRLAEYPRALEELRESEIIAQTLNDPGFSTMILGCKAHVFGMLRLNGEALHCYLLAYPYFSVVAENIHKKISITIELFRKIEENTELYFDVTHYHNWYTTLRLMPEDCRFTYSSARSAIQHPSLTSDTSGFIAEESTGNFLAQQPQRTPDESTLPERNASHLMGFPVQHMSTTLEPARRLMAEGRYEEAMNNLISLLKSHTHDAIPSLDIQLCLTDICTFRGYYRMALFYYRSIFQWRSIVPLTIFNNISFMLEAIRYRLGELVYQDILAWQTSLFVLVETPAVIPE